MTGNVMVRAALHRLSKSRGVQRNRSDEDCAVAAAANAIDVPYEEMAMAFGFPVSGANGQASTPPGRGFHLAEIGPALEKFGLRTATVLCDHIPASTLPSAVRLSAEELREGLTGKTAVVLTIDDDREGHCLAMRDGTLIDPRAPDPYSKSLASSDVVGAVIIRK